MRRMRRKQIPIGAGRRSSRARRVEDLLGQVWPPALASASASDEESVEGGQVPFAPAGAAQCVGAERRAARAAPARQGQASRSSSSSVRSRSASVRAPVELPAPTLPAGTWRTSGQDADLVDRDTPAFERAGGRTEERRGKLGAAARLLGAARGEEEPLARGVHRERELERLGVGAARAERQRRTRRPCSGARVRRRAAAGPGAGEAGRCARSARAPRRRGSAGCGAG